MRKDLIFNFQGTVEQIALNYFKRSRSALNFYRTTVIRYRYAETHKTCGLLRATIRCVEDDLSNLVRLAERSRFLHCCKILDEDYRTIRYTTRPTYNVYLRIRCPSVFDHLRRNKVKSNAEETI